MARTYSFDHFTVPQHGEPAQPSDEKAHVTGKPGARGNGPPRYGRRFAETQELAHVHQMNQQLEELAGLGSPKISRPREPERTERTERPARPVEYLHRGLPIGALPTALAAPPPETFRELLGAGARHLRLLRYCIVDGVAASYRLAKLPLQAAKLTVRTLRSGLASLQPVHQPQPRPT